MNIEPLSQITVTADISRPPLYMTWGDLGWKLGPNDPTILRIKTSLERGEPFDLGGVIISANGRLSAHHGDWSKEK